MIGRKRSLKKDSWDDIQKKILTNLKNTLETAVQNNLLVINTDVVNQIKAVEKILNDEIQRLDGDISKLLQLFQKFFLHPDNGLLPKSFSQINSEVERIEKEFSTFIQNQTKQAHPNLSIASSHLRKLLGKNPSKNEAKTAIKAIKALLNANDAIQGGWEQSDTDNLMKLKASLEQAISKEKFDISTNLKEKISKTLTASIDPKIKKLLETLQRRYSFSKIFF